ITVNYIQNRAMRVNPSLSNTLTETLKDKYRRLTKLKLEPDGGDLVLEGDILSYETRSLAVTAQEVAAQNRLTITVNIKFTNKKHPEDDFERRFEAFEDYASTMSLDQVESNLVDAIVEKLVEDIFNNTVAKW
ncbi:MAG: LptE family protein, partial [Bacteroidales bacterium]|nr:LptE family protein [Bacteroidales bacterium]